MSDEHTLFLDAFRKCATTSRPLSIGWSPVVKWSKILRKKKQPPNQKLPLHARQQWFPLFAETAQKHHRIRSIQNAQQAIRHSSVIFVAPYWNYRISCLKVHLAPLAQDADSEKWNISLDYVKKRLEP